MNSNDDFITRVGTLPIAEQREILERLRALGAELGVSIDTPVEEGPDIRNVERADIDAAFYELMRGVL